jgi:hypothetical protein
MWMLAQLGPQIWVPAISTVAAAMLAYLAAVRKLSGQIETSEAADLWTESASIREYLNEQVKFLNDRIEGLERQLRECHAHIRDMEAARER